MKTIQISDEMWKALRMEAAQRGVTMREVVMDWLTRGGAAVETGRAAPVAGVESRQVVRALRSAVRRAEGEVVNELVVEQDEWIP